MLTKYQFKIYETVPGFSNSLLIGTITIEEHNGKIANQKVHDYINKNFSDRQITIGRVEVLEESCFHIDIG